MLSSICPIDRNTSGATTPDQSGRGSDGNKRVLRIPQSSSITSAWPSDCLLSYLGNSLGESYSYAEMQSVYSAAPANWANVKLNTEFGRPEETCRHPDFIDND